MRSPRFSPRAREDLLEILEYVAADRPAAALRLVARLEARCYLLADHPGVGRLRPDLAADLRSYPSPPYLIYYRPEGETVRIERVLHAARDVDALLGDGDASRRLSE